MLQTFTLKPGVHTVHLVQFENNFRYSHLVLIPKELLTWVPLGMQSRYIPDSALNAYPPSSLPDPKFGRLNGYGRYIAVSLVWSYDVVGRGRFGRGRFGMVWYDVMWYGMV
jgi:hypothetical protein